MRSPAPTSRGRGRRRGRRPNGRRHATRERRRPASLAPKDQDRKGSRWINRRRTGGPRATIAGPFVDSRGSRGARCQSAFSRRGLRRRLDAGSCRLLPSSPVTLTLTGASFDRPSPCRCPDALVEPSCSTALPDQVVVDLLAALVGHDDVLALLGSLRAHLAQTASPVIVLDSAASASRNARQSG